MGVASQIPVTVAGALKDVTVSVEIKHTFIRDLLVDIVAPSGQSATLHNRSGGSADDVIRTYNLSSTPALQSLVGQTIEGDWTLRVRDLEGQDLGSLEKWSLALVY